jgi:hypothetical protein
MSPMHARAGWYPDPSAPGNLRYWSGQEWTASTAPVSQPATYAAPAPAPAWPAQTSAWTNPYAAAASQRPSRPTAAIVTLGIILGVVAIVVVAEISHVLTVRRESASAPAAGSAGTPFTAPTYVPPSSSATSVRLPLGIAGLNLNPQSPDMRHHLTTQAESELSRGTSPITIGYYETPAGSSKVFLEMIDDSPATNNSNPSEILSQLEVDFDDTVAVPAGSTRRPSWIRAATEDINSVMGCEDIIEYNTPIRACAFVQGSTIGVIGVYQPAPGIDPLIDEVRRTIVGS